MFQKAGRQKSFQCFKRENKKQTKPYQTDPTAAMYRNSVSIAIPGLKYYQSYKTQW